MDEALTTKFAEMATEQDAEVRLLERSGLADAILAIAREATATTFSASEDVKSAVADALIAAGLREAELSADIAITGSSWAVAETGSVVVEGSRERFITSGAHVVVVDASRLIPKLDDLPFPESLKPPFTIVTGPSRTADIERVLVLGAHGPRRLIILVV